jgi:hypothetical protein
MNNILIILIIVIVVLVVFVGGVIVVVGGGGGVVVVVAILNRSQFDLGSWYVNILFLYNFLPNNQNQMTFYWLN